MTKDGKNFARVIEYKGGYVLQKGVLISGEVEEEAEEEETEPAAVDEVPAEATASPSPPKSQKGKKDKGKRGGAVLLPEEKPPAMRGRTSFVFVMRHPLCWALLASKWGCVWQPLATASAGGATDAAGAAKGPTSRVPRASDRRVARGPRAARHAARRAR